MKDLIKKTQFEKDVPFQVLEDIVNHLKKSEKEHPEWPIDIGRHIVGGNLGIHFQETLHGEHEAGFPMSAKELAIRVAVIAIRYLKKHHSK